MTVKRRRHTCGRDARALYLLDPNPACPGCRRLRRANRFKRRARLVLCLSGLAGVAVYLMLGAGEGLLTLGAGAMWTAVLSRRGAWLRDTRREVIEEATAAGLAMGAGGACIGAAPGLLGFFG